MDKIKLSNFSVCYEDKIIPSQVPGDITIDLYNAGLVKNPYIAENYKDAEWVGRKDFTYKCYFEISKEQYKYDCINIVFKGIDLLSEIYVNNQLVGNTNNAFLLYRFNVKDLVKVGSNLLEVKMKSTLNYMDTIDTEPYFAIFNLPRMFVRKPQCHFGWDWAPKICAYGIIDDVYIEFKSKYQISDVNSISDDKGNLTVHVLLNYDNKPFYGPNDIVLDEGEKDDGDTIKYYVSKEPYGNEYDEYSVSMKGKKNYLAINKENYKLWWPSGYGEQPLYNLKVELIRGGKVQDTYTSRFAFRSVKRVEEPKDNNLIGMSILINNKPIYLKGSNWVPPECFTGVMKDEKYIELINLAKKMNANLLRVWGGGAYEKDIFFDLCDEQGILVWQDICFACADMPEERPGFVDEVVKEITYQVKRLRNHPSLIYWCGGNEKTGAYGNCISHGDFLVNCTIRGLIGHLDPTRPYSTQSPYSHSDIGNDPNSGDSHYGKAEGALTFGMENYRSELAKNIVPFVSECAVLGPSSVECLKKIFPSDKLWPMNEMWKDRFMENPYGINALDFPHREMKYAEDLYGKVTGLEDFVKKAMLAHAQMLRAECEYSRSYNGQTGAWLNWMFDDIWPSGTWSIVDYSLEPKQAYYQLRKSFKPLLVSFTVKGDGKTYLFVDNQSFIPYSSEIRYGVKDYDGKIIYEDIVKLSNISEKPYLKALPMNIFDIRTYLFAEYTENGEKVTNIYSNDMFKAAKFDYKFTYEVVESSPNKVSIKINAIDFVNSLFIHFVDNYKYQYSDNYLMIEKGCSQTITITSKENIDIKNIQFN